MTDHPTTETLHRLLMPPHPEGVYQQSALCSCGDWQWDSDSIAFDYRAVLRDHTLHMQAATPAQEPPTVPRPGANLDAPPASLSRAALHAQEPLDEAHIDEVLSLIGFDALRRLQRYGYQVTRLRDKGERP